MANPMSVLKPLSDLFTEDETTGEGKKAKVRKPKEVPAGGIDTGNPPPKPKKPGQASLN